MGRFITDLAIVNRSFWPEGQVIGESLLQFAEKMAESSSVCVITQANGKLRQKLKEQSRGIGVRMYVCKAITSSNANLLKRTIEAFLFTIWTLYCLLKSRPSNIYVSTNPPILVPFIVAVYSRCFGAKYIYHLQDIHPEITNIKVTLNTTLYKFLIWLDNFTLQHADSVLTLCEEMKTYITQRSGTKRPIYIINNPSVEVASISLNTRGPDIVFCGNAGRLQLMPLIIEAINQYCRDGGSLRFTFAGGGIYQPEIEALATMQEKVDYRGIISAAEASRLVSQHRWGLLPIEDEVCSYAFPSKSAGYAMSGVAVLAICGGNTSVARWVRENEVGLVVAPELTAIVSAFRSIEENLIRPRPAPREMRRALEIPYFVSRLTEFVG